MHWWAAALSDFLVDLDLVKDWTRRLLRRAAVGFLVLFHEPVSIPQVHALSKIHDFVRAEGKPLLAHLSPLFEGSALRCRILPISGRVHGPGCLVDWLRRRELAGAFL